MSDLSLLCAPKRTFAASGFMGSRALGFRRTADSGELYQGCSLHHSGHLTLWGVRVAPGFRLSVHTPVLKPRNIRAIKSRPITWRSIWC